MRLKSMEANSMEFNPIHSIKGNPSSFLYKTLKNMGYIVGITAAATLVSFTFKMLHFHESNYIMTYNLGILLIAYLTDGYSYAVIASILGVLTFNYFFTEPYYTFLAYSPEYPVTLIIKRLRCRASNKTI